jgi:hypothetical protein
MLCDDKTKERKAQQRAGCRIGIAEAPVVSCDACVGGVPRVWAVEDMHSKCSNTLSVSLRREMLNGRVV